MSGFLHSLKNITGSKHGQDTRMRFSVAPLPGDSTFVQWHDAMMMCARLPGGIPQEFRRRLWLTLSEKHLQARGVDWSHAQRFCFNEWSNPDDDELGDQIVKDLHRTGCSLFCGEEAEDNQAMLKRVLLAYARWNKGVGYCQGFNMLAAIILEVMERQESDALKVMIYLIEGVLPESYFANNLRGLSVDMAVFRDLLRLRLPHLSRHLEHLQHDAADLATGTSYEPPLTNVFTMQWFLTLFSNCLPRETVMRVWDLTFLQGNEVLLRTALAIWDGLAARILEVHSADEFYTVMGTLTREMLTPGALDANKLVHTVVGMAPFPFPGLADLRDKYTYNITPWTQSVSSVAKRGLRLFYSDDDDDDEDYDDNDDDDQKIAVATAFGLSGIFRKSIESSRGPSPVTGGGGGGSSAAPASAFPSLGGSHHPRHGAHDVHREISRPNLDISALKKQYARLRERQKQAHIILTSSQLRVGGAIGGVGGGQKSTPLTMNHLLRGKKALTSKTRRVVPVGVIPVMKTKKKVERKLSDTTGFKSAAHQHRQQQQQLQQQQQQQQQPPSALRAKQPLVPAPVAATAAGALGTGAGQSQHQPVKRFQSGPTEPPKVETLHWKDTPRRDRRASLPSGVKLLEGKPLSTGTLGVPDEMDDDGGSSTSTELCDDDEEDKLSDLEPEPESEPRPATTSPRLETVLENGKSSSEKPSPRKEDELSKKEENGVPPVTIVSTKLETQEDKPKELGPELITLPNTLIPSANIDIPQTILLPQAESQEVKEELQSVPESKESPVWTFQSTSDTQASFSIPLEDLLAGKSLTAAEIIARIPFPSDVSFMKEEPEEKMDVQNTLNSNDKDTSDPFYSLHNVTPEKSPIDSPIPRFPSPIPEKESSLIATLSPATSPSKSPPSRSHSPTPKGSPCISPDMTTDKSPSDQSSPPRWSISRLPPITQTDTAQDAHYTPPRSPKITLQDEMSNIFEIHSGLPPLLQSVQSVDVKDITLPENGKENLDGLLETSEVSILKETQISNDSLPKDVIIHATSHTIAESEEALVIKDNEREELLKEPEVDDQIEYNCKITPEVTTFSTPLISTSRFSSLISELQEGKTLDVEPENTESKNEFYSFKRNPLLISDQLDSKSPDPLIQSSETNSKLVVESKSKVVDISVETEVISDLQEDNTSEKVDESITKMTDAHDFKQDAETRSVLWDSKESDEDKNIEEEVKFFDRFQETGNTSELQNFAELCTKMERKENTSDFSSFIDNTKISLGMQDGTKSEEYEGKASDTELFDFKKYSEVIQTELPSTTSVIRDEALTTSTLGSVSWFSSLSSTTEKTFESADPSETINASSVKSKEYSSDISSTAIKFNETSPIADQDLSIDFSNLQQEKLAGTFPISKFDTLPGESIFTSVASEKGISSTEETDTNISQTLSSEDNLNAKLVPDTSRDLSSFLHDKEDNVDVTDHEQNSLIPSFGGETIMHTSLITGVTALWESDLAKIPVDREDLQGGKPTTPKDFDISCFSYNTTEDDHFSSQRSASIEERSLAFLERDRPLLVDKEPETLTSPEVNITNILAETSNGKNDSQEHIQELKSPEPVFKSLSTSTESTETNITEKFTEPSVPDSTIGMSETVLMLEKSAIDTDPAISPVHTDRIFSFLSTEFSSTSTPDEATFKDLDHSSLDRIPSTSIGAIGLPDHSDVSSSNKSDLFHETSETMSSRKVTETSKESLFETGEILPTLSSSKINTESIVPLTDETNRISSFEAETDVTNITTSSIADEAESSLFYRSTEQSIKDDVTSELLSTKLFEDDLLDKAKEADTYPTPSVFADKKQVSKEDLKPDLETNENIISKLLLHDEELISLRKIAITQTASPLRNGKKSPSLDSSVGRPSPVVTPRDGESLSTSLEGRLSFLSFSTSYEGDKAEEDKAEACSKENDEDKNLEESETDIFNGKDLSSEAIRQRLWRGVKSLSLDADVTLDPDVFCFLIQQCSKTAGKSGSGKKLMGRRRNSEVELQELVKENTEIIERILKQKSLEESKIYCIREGDADTTSSSEDPSRNERSPVRSASATTFCTQSTSRDHLASLRLSKVVSDELSSEIENSLGKNERDTVANAKSGGLSPQNGSRTLASCSPSSSSSSQPKWSYTGNESEITIKSCGITKSFTKPSKLSRSSSVTLDNPTRPITFNPFPTRNINKPPKEVAVKLGLYSPNKTPGSSPT